MLRIITVNLNGIRSAAKRGFFNWMLQQHADVICVQETKAQMETIPIDGLRPESYYSYFADAEKPGYSGVGIYCKQKPDKVIKGFGWHDGDSEGRYIQADFGKLSVVSLYLPSGTTGDIRQAVKYKFLEHFLEFLKKLRQDKRQYIICGDWNIAHRMIDIKNWKANQKHSGFFPDERAWMDRVLDDHGWVDAFRVLNQEAEQYTWWSRRGQAYAKNVGWRIDYQIVTPELKDKIKKVEIYKAEQFSDHAPLIIDYIC